MSSEACEQGKKAGEVEEGRPSLCRKSLHHFWEEDVFRVHDAPVAVRESCLYTGFPRARLGHKPLLLATVQGVDEQGRPFSWIARRARKRVLQPHECPSTPPPVSWLETLRFKSCIDKPGWWVAALFVVGSIIFLITGIARMTAPVTLPDKWPPGVGSLAAGLAPWPEVMACYLLFFPATLLQVLEAVNMDYGCRLRALQESGGSRRFLGPRWLPTQEDLHTVSFWAMALQVIGMLGFNMAVTVDLVSHSVGVSSALERWGLAFGFAFGGTCFMVSGALASMEETGVWWRCLVPTRWDDVRSISWLAVFFSFHGSVGFTFFGAALMADGWSWASIQGIVFYGQVLASILFLLSGVAGLLEQANPSHL